MTNGAKVSSVDILGGPLSDEAAASASALAPVVKRHALDYLGYLIAQGCLDVEESDVSRSNAQLIEILDRLEDEFFLFSVRVQPILAKLPSMRKRVARESWRPSLERRSSSSLKTRLKVWVGALTADQRRWSKGKLAELYVREVRGSASLATVRKYLAGMKIEPV